MTETERAPSAGAHAGDTVVQGPTLGVAEVRSPDPAAPREAASTTPTAFRLAGAASAYLRQHAHQPVAWYPWGAEALARARREERPIFLSVGYAACHWCHVMAHESFEDPRVAALLNEHFVCVKVDREERPDVDQLYQGVLQLLGRGGGWPLSVFLTPALAPFFAGTYFPPEPRHGLPAFGELLQRVADAWREGRDELEREAAELRDALERLAREGLEAEPASAQATPPGRGALRGASDARGGAAAGGAARAAELIAAHVDPRFGGLGPRGPKFPNPALIELCLAGGARPRAAALLWLERMAQGGIFDQLGGGFCRYSVDERWAVPHFEKMLSDNAQLLHACARAMQCAPRPLWERTARLTVEWLERELRDVRGGFFSSLDADSDGEEGKHYVWTQGELRAAVAGDGALAERLAELFGVTPEGNFDGGATVLALVRPELLEGPDAAQLERGRRALLVARRRRTPPGLDDKVLAGWNGLAVGGLALAGRVFRRPRWIALARGAADFVLAALRRDDGELARLYHGGRASGRGQLEDYGHCALGLVELYQATFDARYLREAEALAERALALFFDAERCAYLAAPRGTEDLLVPLYSVHDGAAPSGASALTAALVALGALGGSPRHLEHARRYVERLRGAMAQSPTSFGQLWQTADALERGAPAVRLSGSRREVQPFVEHLCDAAFPWAVVRWDAPASAPGAASAPGTLDWASSLPAAGGGAQAVVCSGQACALPVTRPEGLDALLSGGG